MILYIDTFFLINFLLDFLVLFVAAYLGGIKIRLGRMLFSSALGAGFAVLAVLFAFMASLAVKFIVISLMSLAAFGFLSLKVYLRQTAILLVGFFLQGGAAGLLSLYGRGSVYSGFYRADFPLIGIFAAVAASTVAIFVVSGKIRAQRGKSFAYITVYTEGKSFNLTALYDSGNVCTDALTNLPVIVAENVFPGIKTKENIFTTASGIGEMGIFYPDFVKVRMERKIFEGRDVCIGIIEGKLSDDENFNALIGGICFDRLVEKNDTPYFSSEKGGRSLLHRDGISSSAAPELKRGGIAFKEA